jgi:tRNA G37 N-methylase Trm5
MDTPSRALKDVKLIVLVTKEMKDWIHYHANSKQESEATVVRAALNDYRLKMERAEARRQHSP